MISPEVLKKKDERFRNVYGNNSYVPVREFIKKKHESNNTVSQSYIMSSKRDDDKFSSNTTSRNVENQGFESPKKSHQVLSNKLTSPSSPQKYY